jgi:hypothetical protein
MLKRAPSWLLVIDVSFNISGEAFCTGVDFGDPREGGLLFSRAWEVQSRLVIKEGVLRGVMDSSVDLVP